MSWNPVVIGVDRSEPGRDAAVVGIRLAEALGAQAYLVHGTPPVVGPVVPGELYTDVTPALTRQVARVREQLVVWLGGTVPPAALDRLEVRFGRGAGVVAQVARERKAGLVVVGGKHHTALGRWLAGSTAHHLVRTLDAPVWVTGPSPHVVKRVLVALDLSYAVHRTFEAAVRAARLYGASLRAMHAVAPFPVIAELPPLTDYEAFHADSEQELERCLEPLTEDVVVERSVRRGYAPEAIAAEVNSWGADLVVVGSHGRGWMERLLVGSTTERLLNQLPTSLLVVPVPAPVEPRGARAKPARQGRHRRAATTII